MNYEHQYHTLTLFKLTSSRDVFCKQKSCLLVLMKWQKKFRIQLDYNFFIRIVELKT